MGLGQRFKKNNMKHNVIKTENAYVCTNCGEAHGDGDGFVGQNCHQAKECKEDWAGKLRAILGDIPNQKVIEILELMRDVSYAAYTNGQKHKPSPTSKPSEWEKAFDKKFTSHEGGEGSKCSFLDSCRTVDIKSFIRTEIEAACQELRDEWAKKIEEMHHDDDCVCSEQACCGKCGPSYNSALKDVLDIINHK